jgi:hypothetical protein
MGRLLSKLQMDEGINALKHSTRSKSGAFAVPRPIVSPTVRPSDNVDKNS